ncbi:TDT family transporter [Dermacoccaceae bacterium W4C1]
MHDTRASRLAGTRAARTHEPTAAPVLPAVGPAWFGSLMGTSILATLIQVHARQWPWLQVFALLMLGVAVLLAAFLLGGTGIRLVRRPGMLAESTRTPERCAQWGMVAMGLMALGAAISTVLPAQLPGWTAAAWRVDALLWVAGTVLGVLTAVAVPAQLVAARPSVPTLVWGLAVVPPMVSATTGVALAQHLSHPGARAALLVAVALCFAGALMLATIIFGLAIRHHWLVEPVPVNNSVSAWLPLGIIGQSAAAAVTFAHAAQPLLAAQVASGLRSMALDYAIAVLIGGLILIAWALKTTFGGFRAGMRFNPGWWGMTFPVGTLCLGAHQVAAAGGPAVFEVASQIALVTLIGTWSGCAAATLAALGSRGRGRVSEVVADVRSASTEDQVPERVLAVVAADQSRTAQVGVAAHPGEPQREASSLEMRRP